ncbi:MAG: branched-chain amino acid ABC transporter substrate-binding protein [Actinomycetales bacterium]|jgi:branched-chain amino acid transport system substrate-binding protein|nr:branched-chain amino acid ABC transporter substrate-binding protein [Actinomycetales bacterium]
MKKSFKKVLAVTAAGALVAGASVLSTANAAVKSVSLAFQAPLTGPNALTGQDELTGVRFALSEYAATNPAVKVELVLADDQGDPTIAGSLAPGIASNKKIIGLVGPAYSGATQASLPAYKAGGLPLISPSATRVSLTDRKAPVNGFPIFKRVVANDKFQGPALVRYATKGVTSPKVYLVDDVSAYGAGLAAYAKLTITAAMDAGKDSVPQNTSDYTSVVAKVKASGANVVIYCGYAPDAAKFVKALRDGGFTGVFASGDGTLKADFPVNAGKSAAEGARLTAADVPFENVATAAQMVAFTKLTGVKVPGTYVTSSYNATNVFLACIKQGVTTRPGMQNCITNGTFTGIAGDTIKFDRYGDIIGGAAVGAFTIKDGKVAYIGVA